MNAFERHGITHLSASSINLYAAQPAIWVMQRLLKKSGPVGAAAHRGTAAETGIVHGLLNTSAPVEECQAAALAQYDSLTALSGDPKRLKERDAVPAIVATALPELRAYGIPDEVQHRIEVTLPEIPIPFVGFVDLGWSSHGITLDIKSTLRLPNSISTPHARQVGLYLHGTNREGRVAYRRDHLENLLAKVEAELADPDRIATAEEVAALWLLLLDRRQVPPAVMEQHAGRSTVRELRRAIVRMGEFRRRTAP